MDLSLSHFNTNTVASAQGQLGVVANVGKSEASLKKPDFISKTDQTEILKSISDGYTLEMKDGKIENVGTFFTILEDLSKNPSLSKSTKDYITQIKGNFEAVKTDLQDKSPIDEPTIATVIPSMLDGIHQLFELVSLLDNDTGINKQSFQKIAKVALDCKTKFQADPAQSRMINHVKSKLDYFLQKDDNSALSNTDPLLSITIFADVDSNLQTLFQPTAITKPVIPIPPKSNQAKDLRESPIVKKNWAFSEGPVAGGQNRLYGTLVNLAFTTDTPVTPGNFLKNNSRITDEALEQIKRLTEENMKALVKNDQEVLLVNLKKLKDQFDLSDLGLLNDSIPTTINKKINELGKTDIRKVVQEKIEFLKSSIIPPS